MKRNYIFALGWLSGLMLTCFASAKAQQTVPCLIFTGHSDTVHSIDLSKLNRISFDDDGMTVSSDDDSAQDVKLLYSLFYHIEIGEAVPTDATGVDAVAAESDAGLRYSAANESLVMESASDKPYSIGIFSLNGTLIATAKMSAGESLYVGSLSAGSYIAVASDGKSQFTIKFIRK